MSEPKLVNRVREVRSARGLTQASLAEAVGVSRQSINYIEQGTFAPSVILALRIARVLGTTVEALFMTEDA
jgi:putative transcriptional regulator